MLNKVFISLLILLISCCELFGFEKKLESSQQLTISDGLAHNGVTSILEDSNGYLWFGTYDGLSRYDGYEIKIYKNTIDQNLLVSNRVRTLSEDRKGNLWIGTDEGISIYNTSKEEFIGIYSNQMFNQGIRGPIVRDILICNEEDVIIASTEGDGILIFDKNNTFSKQFIPSSTISSEEVLFFGCERIDDSNFLFVSSAGLLHFNLKSEKFTPLVKDDITECNSITRIDAKTLLITCSFGISVVKYKQINGAYKFKQLHSYLKTHKFNSSSIDKFGNVWLGALTAGIVHIENVDNLKNNTAFKENVFSISTGVLRGSCIESSLTSGCWFGSFNEGLFRFDLDENPFKKYNTQMGYDLDLKSNLVTHFSSYDKDRVFVTANLGGIALFNLATENFEPLPFDVTEKVRLKMSSVYVDPDKNIWIKINGKTGLYRVLAGTRKVKKVVDDVFSEEIALRSYSIDRKDNLWIGTNDNVYQLSLDRKGNIVKLISLNDHEYFKNDQLKLVRYVYVDPLYDFVWVGADSDGLFRIDVGESGKLQDLKIDQYRSDKEDIFSISSNFVTSIVRLPNQELWIGTEGGGICKVLKSNEKPEFISYTEKQGLSNNVVKSVLYDEEYNLWVATNIGLNKFDTKDFRFRKFSTIDGLPFEDFWFAAHKQDNGIIMLSGLDGFCYFNSEELPDREELPIFEFGDFKLFNKTIFPGDTISDRVLLDRRLNEQEEIFLEYDENVFSIELKSLHFSTPDNHFLKYQLLPINDEWVEVPSDQRHVYYSGLRPGEYTLNVMASNSLKNWTEPRTLKIIIHPPLWETPQAYLSYIVLLGLVIYLILFFVLRFQNLNHKLQIEKLEKDNVKEVNAAKLRFFSNISHEIKTPITLIKGPVELLLDRFNSNADVKEKLQLVQRQSKKISQLVDQVHDFQRSDANRLKLNYSSFCFNDFIKELCLDFEFIANNHNKNLNVKNPDSKIYVSADRDKLEKIINNLLNNAFKFTKADDTITIEYSIDGKELELKVSDTGRGISKEDLPFIFERFYQSKQKYGAYTGGSGIGLAFSKRLVEMHYGFVDAESELEKGTCIKVSLPIVDEFIVENQEEREEEILLAEKEMNPDVSVVKSVSKEDIKLEGDFAGASVFLAEDNDDMRSFVSGILSKFFKVRAFVNGQECLKAMEEEWPDIVISDILMPELNGLELCRHIKSDIKTSHIPVILLTACATIDDQIKGIKEGADSYIKKPFDIQHLVTRTEYLLSNRKQLRERFQIDLPLTLEKNKDKGSDSIFLEKLYRLMADNLDNQDLDLNTFAKELYLNRTHFYQKVKALTNQTPFELLKMYRLKKAAEFLVQQQLSVNEVYMMTGFKSRTHFSKLFKEKYNVTPGKYAAESIKKYAN